MAKQKIYRQGDVLFILIDGEPMIALRKLRHRVIAEGEATGHKHQFLKNTAVLLAQTAEDSETPELDEGYCPKYFLNVRKETEIVHEEHHTVTLPVGFYSIVIQREYVPKSLRTKKETERGGFSYVAD